MLASKRSIQLGFSGGGVGGRFWINLVIVAFIGTCVIKPD